MEIDRTWIVFQVMRLIRFFLICLLLLSPAPFLAAGMPRVQIKGRVLLVDGKSYVIKGVCWSPTSIGAALDYESRRGEFAKWHEKDIELISRMRANTVYTFIDFGDDAKAIEILDALHRHGLKAIVTVDLDGTRHLERIREIVPKYKNHPAILMWAIGNEWNINLYHQRFPTLLAAAQATEEAARLVKSLDDRHPVASILGEIIMRNQPVAISAIVNEIAPSVDVWGLNIYRGGGFGDLFDYWKSFSTKPMFLSEFGTDSYYSTSWWPVKGRVEEEMQRGFDLALWKDLSANLSACDPNKAALGGTVFEWVDEWWKVKPENGGGSARQDPGGFPTTWNAYSHPDAFANEEYFGMVRIDRSAKPVYWELQSQFAKNPCSKD